MQTNHHKIQLAKSFLVVLIVGLGISVACRLSPFSGVSQEVNTAPREIVSTGELAEFSFVAKRSFFNKT